MLEAFSAIGVLLCLWVAALVFLCDEEEIALSLRLTFYTFLGIIGGLLGIGVLDFLVRTAWNSISAV